MQVKRVNNRYEVYTYSFDFSFIFYFLLFICWFIPAFPITLIRRTLTPISSVSEIVHLFLL